MTLEDRATGRSGAPGAPSSPPTADAVRALLVLVARGNRAALADLYDLTGALVFGLLGARMAEPDRSDALVRVYLHLWRTSPSRLPAPDPARWVAEVIGHPSDRVRPIRPAPGP